MLKELSSTPENDRNRHEQESSNMRSNPDDLKVGGHQASSASMVSILTALYFHYLDAGDRVSIKPHASPAYHAIQYLLGNLDQRYLLSLRAFNGLQAYPSLRRDAYATVPLGVDRFGQSGSHADLYQYTEISVEDIVGAGYLAWELSENH